MVLHNFRRLSLLLHLKHNKFHQCSLSSVCKYTITTKRDYNSHHSGNKSASSLGLLSVGTVVGAVFAYELIRNKDDLPKLLPSVEACLTGRRMQYNFIADVVDQCAQSVVYIEIKDLRHFDYYTGTPVTASSGSGFIIDSNGLILTNAHVVINKPYTVVQVRLSDGRTFHGFLESLDRSSDLATVRIECTELPVMKLGESTSLRPGEWVVALGSPLSLSNTVTAGVVSNTQRASQELGLRGLNTNYIQTDAAITFGNSGGPLVNLEGEAIGVNSMNVASGISFAIPIDYVKQFLIRRAERKSKRGPVRQGYHLRRYMGITVLGLTDEMLQELKSLSRSVPDEVKHGVLVWKVIPGSPADAGGLAPGDIVTHINGKEVRNYSDIYDVLGENTKSLEIIIYRGLKKMNVSVKPEDP